MDDELLIINEENIEINFIINGQEYVVLSNDIDDENIYIGKIVQVDDAVETIVSIEDEDEYKMALAEYVSLLEYEMEEHEYES